MVSNALDKSKYMLNGRFPLSNSFVILSVISSAASPVECPCLNPYCHL